jgi:serralysin
MSSSTSTPRRALAALGALFLLAATVPSALAADVYVLPAGAGDKSGKDFANAKSGSDISTAIAGLKGGDTLRIGSGEYDGTFTVKVSGSGPKSMVTITGEDSGGGLPVFKGTYKPGDKSGGTMIGIEEGVKFLAIKNIKAESYPQFVRLKGKHQAILLENLDIDKTRDAFWIEGGGNPSVAESGSKDLVFKDCDVTTAVKRGFRTMNGNTKLQFINCSADMGGEANALEPFAVGFHVLGAYGEKDRGGDKEGTVGLRDKDITFIGCRASNAFHNAGPDKYWNADGFCAEGATENITWIDCIAYANTDGGWDVKSDGIKLVNCIGIDNKRNFRFWKDTVMENCLSAFSHDRGNRGHALGMWGKGGANFQLTNCTFFNEEKGRISIEDASAEKTTKVVLKNCLIEGELPQGKEFVTFENQGSVAEASVALKSPNKEWRGGDQSFDSTAHQGKGYRYVKAGSQAAK